ETRFGFAENPKTGVSSDSRPGELQEWVRSGHGLRSKKGFDPRILDLAGYAKRWGAWWDLQPEWRKRGDDRAWVSGGEYDKKWEWDCLAFPGQNGCLSIVAGLFFWGSSRYAVGATNGWTVARLAEWDGAVQDVVWMMEGLEQSLPRPRRGTVKKLLSQLRDGRVLEF
ncbi:hypothetical protein DFH09DRAFT_936608, partial [Mycena vulgaris]